MQIKSVFNHGEEIPSKYTADGEDINPFLEFIDILEEAKSLVLIVDDPDAPMGTWVHWVVWNISPGIKRIEEDSVPDNAVQGMNDFKKQDYGGPSPPSGIHRYFFKLYALDKELNLPESSEKADVEKEIHEHILDKAELIGTYTKR